jgi:replication factor C subunit 2/4
MWLTLKYLCFPFHRLEDLVAQDDIVSILTNLIDSDNLPHLLLYGPPGTGKTSTIVAAAKRMYGGSAAYSSMTLELNASDARGIDVSSSLGSTIGSFSVLAVHQS